MHFRRLIIFIATAVGVAHSKPERRPAYEPLPTPQNSSAGNLFSGAQTTASGQWQDNGPGRAVDGKIDPSSHWAAENLPVWHQLDLGAPKKISALRVWPYWGDGRIYQYKVEGSTDGQTWTMLGDHTANSIASSAEGDPFSFAPRDVRYVRTTFLKNSKGAASGGHLVEIAGYAEGSSGLTGGVGSIDLRYPPDGKLELAPTETGAKLVAWRGERVNSQFVVSSRENQNHLRIQTYPPKELPGAEFHANFIRYTLANGKPQGDIIDSAEILPLAVGANRPIWLSIDVPRDAKPGTYQGGVIVRSDSSEIRFPVSIEVLPQALPAPQDWKFHLDLWQHPDAVARWHDVPMWSDEHFALMEPMMKRLADAGQKTITTTLVDEAWGGQTYDKFGSMIGWTKKKDGSWVYDYTIFDKWVSFMIDKVGMKNARIHCYTMIPWSLKFSYFDEGKNAFAQASLKPGTPEYDEYWGRFLKDFSAHLKSKGWLERTLIGIDERPDALMKGALETLRKHAPALRIASAINHPTALSREFADISPIISHADTVEPLLAERHAAGKKTTFYTCTSPPVPNTFTFSPPAESEWLGLFAAARNLDGYLRWAYNSWVENPLESTDFTTWPSGDCFLVYPGNRSSIRFERLRDGIENWEKIRLLRDAKADMTTIDGTLKQFTWARGKTPGVHTEDVRKANAAIEAAARNVH
ncbi:MAG: glycoside hydrolase domain-containing protein [Verrucomicrobiota bacterium]